MTYLEYFAERLCALTYDDQRVFIKQRFNGKLIALDTAVSYALADRRDYAAMCRYTALARSNLLSRANYERIQDYA